MYNTNIHSKNNITLVQKKGPRCNLR